MAKATQLTTGSTGTHPLHPVPGREEELSAKLDKLTKEMNEFTYIVSHDLQAPLRTVTGFLELLEKRHGDKLDASAKQYIDYAIKGAGKMKDLVFDLLEYSRLSSGVIEFTSVDLNGILEEVKEKVAATISETGAIITTDALPVVLADKKQMLQFFLHLLENALKFRRERTDIHMTAKQEKGKWVIGIKDNGTGIDAAYAEKIFIIFRRLNTDEVKYPGTGSGLAICKKIMEIHNGHIWVESEVNTGSTFWFTLPEGKSN